MNDESVSKRVFDRILRTDYHRKFEWKVTVVVLPKTWNRSSMEDSSFGPISFERTNPIGEGELCSVVPPYVYPALSHYFRYQFSKALEKIRYNNTFKLHTIEIQ